MDIPQKIESNEMEPLRLASKNLRNELKELEEAFENGNCEKQNEMTKELDKKFGELRMTFIQKVQKYNKKEGRKNTTQEFV